jgi:NADH-quinone oxidoreductase subunit L
MGGLRKQLPITHITFLVACLAIAGIPPFSGFFSKEEILLAAYHSNKMIFGIALFTSGLTAFYMFRLYFSIFWNKPASHSHQGKEGSFALLFPLVVLAIGAVFAGFIPFGNYVSSDGIPLPTSLHLQFSIAPVLIGLAGILLAAWFYKNKSERPGKLATSLNGFYTTVLNKFYIDELYLFVTKKVLFNLVGKPAAWFDKNVVDGLVNFSGNSTIGLSEKIKGFQSGKVQQYAIIFLVSVLLLAVLIIYIVNLS